MTPYNGEDRRKQNQADHDLLIKIDANLENFLKTFKDHVQDDKDGFNNHNERLEVIEKSWWKACGAMSVVVIALQFVLKLFFK